MKTLAKLSTIGTFFLSIMGFVIFGVIWQFATLILIANDTLVGVEYTETLPIVAFYSFGAAAALMASWYVVFPIGGAFFAMICAYSFRVARGQKASIGKMILITAMVVSISISSAAFALFVWKNYGEIIAYAIQHPKEAFGIIQLAWLYKLIELGFEMLPH